MPHHGGGGEGTLGSPRVSQEAGGGQEPSLWFLW